MTARARLVAHGPGVWLPLEAVPSLALAVRLGCREIGRQAAVPQVLADAQVDLAVAAARLVQPPMSADLTADHGTGSAVPSALRHGPVTTAQLAARLGGLSPRRAREVAAAGGVHPLDPDRKPHLWRAVDVERLVAARTAA
jgi:hypothetical protein